VREGVFDSFDSTQLEAIIRRTLEPATQGKIGKAWDLVKKDILAPQSEALADISQAIGTRQRVALALTLIESGLHPRMAVQVTVDALFDYKFMLSPGDRNGLVQFLLPFWAWQKGAQRWTIGMMLQSPATAWRMSVIRRIPETFGEAASWVLMGWGTQDGAWDNTLGVDRKSKSGSQLAWYEGIIAQMVESYPDGKVPEDVVAALRANLAAPKQPGIVPVIGAKSARYLSDIGPKPDADLLGIPAAAVTMGSPGASPSYYRERGKIVLLPRQTMDLMDWNESQGRNATWSEIVLPESTVAGGLRVATALVASGIFAAAWAPDLLGHDDGIEGKLAPILAEIADPYRSPGLGDLLRASQGDPGPAAYIPEPMAIALKSMGFDVEEITVKGSEEIEMDGRVQTKMTRRVRYRLPPGLPSVAWRHLGGDIVRLIDAVSSITHTTSTVPPYQIAARQDLGYLLQKNVLGLVEGEVSPSETARKTRYAAQEK
jgi:hypothetical protein